MAKTNYTGKIMQVYEFSRKYMAENTVNPYHNFRHSIDVACVSKELGKQESVSEREQSLLVTASLLHDVVFEYGSKYNEEMSAGLARYVMRKSGYNDEDRNIVTGLILATKITVEPNTLLQKILCDADLWNIQRYDFMEKGELLRKEWNREKNRQWYEQQLGLIANHHYHTDSAKAQAVSGIEKNKQVLEKILEVV